MSGLPLTIAVRIEPAARGPECEIRRLALGSLPFGTRERRADERTVYGPFIPIAFIRGLRGDGIGGSIDGFGVGIHLGLGGDDRFRLRSLGSFRQVIGPLELGFHGVRLDAARARVDEHAFTGRRLPAARRGQFRSTVLMVRVARGASRLLHRVVDHRDDGVIGDPALARTIVVENVTEPNPALLHEVPRSRFHQVGIRPLTPLEARNASERAS
jgi:hypothetical protein